MVRPVNPEELTSSPRHRMKPLVAVTTHSSNRAPKDHGFDASPMVNGNTSSRTAMRSFMSSTGQVSASGFTRGDGTSVSLIRVLPREDFSVRFWAVTFTVHSPTLRRAKSRSTPGTEKSFNGHGTEIAMKAVLASRRPL
jgi:hypothetical protein